MVVVAVTVGVAAVVTLPVMLQQAQAVENSTELEQAVEAQTGMALGETVTWRFWMSSRLARVVGALPSTVTVTVLSSRLASGRGELGWSRERLSGGRGDGSGASAPFEPLGSVSECRADWPVLTQGRG